MAIQKENTIAIMAGFILGFTAAAVIFYFPQLTKKGQTTSLPTVLDAGKSVPSPKEPLLSVIVPEDYTESRDGKVTVRGKTKPKSIVVFTTHDTDYAAEVDPTGNFEQPIVLAVGTNDIVITAYLPDNEQETVRKTLIVLPKAEE